MPSQLSERVRILLYSAALFCFYNFTQTIAGSLICCYSLSAWKVHEVGNCKKKKLCSLIFWLHGSCSVKVLSFWKSRSNIKISRAFKVFGSTCFIKVQIKKVSTKTMLKKISCSPTSEFYSVLTEKNLSAAWKEKKSDVKQINTSDYCRVIWHRIQCWLYDCLLIEDSPRC